MTITVKNFGQETCQTSIEFSTKYDSTFIVNSNNIWVNFIPTNDTCRIAFGIPPSTLNIIDSVFMYSGSCNNLTLLNKYSVVDSFFSSRFTNLNLTTNYYFNIKFKNTYNSLFRVSILRQTMACTPPPPCPAEACNLIFDGGFECVCPNYDPDSPFYFNQVLSWEVGWGSPNLNTGNPATGYSAFMWSAKLSSTYIQGEGIYQDVTNVLQNGFDYELTYDYYNVTNEPVDLNIDIGYFTPWGNSSGGCPKPAYVGNYLQLYSTPLHILYTGSWITNQKVSFTYNTVSPKAFLTIYPYVTNDPIGVAQFVKIENVKLKPKVTFNHPNPSIICLGESITISASLPSTYTNLSYSWTGPNGFVATTQSITVIPSAISSYQVTITDNIACTYTEIFIVDPVLLQTPIISGSNYTCESPVYSVTNPSSVPGVTYTWTIINGSNNSQHNSIITNQGNSTVNIAWDETHLACDFITLKVEETIGTCTTTSSINIIRCCGKGDASTVFNNLTIDASNYSNYSSNQSGTFYINGTLTIKDNSHIIFKNSPPNISVTNIRFGENAKIIVEPGSSLTITNCYLTIACCEKMWDGIYLSDYSSNIDLRNSTVEFAINGIVAENNTNVTISDNIFNRNLTSINIINYPALNPSQLALYIKGNAFHGGPLLPPYQYSEYGIKVQNVDNITIGDLNTFDNLYCGIYGYNSYMKIKQNSFSNIQTNIQNSNCNLPGIITYPNCAFAIYSAHPFTPTTNPPISQVEITNGNIFNNCKNGIGVYNETAIISDNKIGAIDYGIYVIKPLNATKINNNKIIQNTNLRYAEFGMYLVNTMPTTTQIDIQANDVEARSIGIWTGQIQQGLVVHNNTIKLIETNDIQFAERYGIRVENCLQGKITCNTVDRYPVILIQDAMVLHGISIANTLKAEVNENTIKNVGAGINVYGDCYNTNFGCNVLQSDFYGFLFNQHALISDQGSFYKATDNQFTPNGNYTSNGYERKLWEYNSSLPIAAPFIIWRFRDNAYIYDPDNISILNPTNSRIVINTSTPDAESTCGLGCVSTASPFSENFSMQEREQKFGKIVRNQDTYTNLEEQYKSYNRYLLYKLLQENNSLIYMGDSSDYLYEQFFNEQSNGNIGTYDSLLTLIAMGNIDEALVLNNTIQDSKLIDYNQKIVTDIYLRTFAVDNYYLDSAQYDTLYYIATNYTPWEGGMAVYTARYMLGVDIDFTNPNVQFSKGSKGNQPEIPFVMVFPNPASDRLIMEFKDAIEGGYVIDIYNYIGVKVLSEKITQMEAEHIINTSAFKNGVYMYNITTNTNIFKGKFTVLK